MTVGMVRPCSCPTSNRILGRGAKDKEHAMTQTRHFDRAPLTSGLPQLADILRVNRHVSNVPFAERTLGSPAASLENPQTVTIP